MPGIEPWHFVCPNCGYEGSILEPVINDRQAHRTVDEQAREAGLKAIRVENFREVVRLILDLQPAEAGRALLDVGAAHGWFLEEARHHFRVLGVEPDAVVQAATAARGLPVRGGYFPQALENGEMFDVIVFNDVIEHIPSIDEALAACAARLHPGGLLVLNLPNSRGFFYRLAGLLARFGWAGPFARLWQEGLPSPHVHYFDRGNLTRLVGRHGFVLANDAELPSIRIKGLAARLRCADPSLASFILQYLGTLVLYPLARVLPSDTIVCLFRKET